MNSLSMSNAVKSNSPLNRTTEKLDSNGNTTDTTKHHDQLHQSSMMEIPLMAKKGINGSSTKRSSVGHPPKDIANGQRSINDWLGGTKQGLVGNKRLNYESNSGVDQRNGTN